MSSCLYYPKQAASLDDIILDTCQADADTELHASLLSAANSHIPNPGIKLFDNPFIIPGSANSPKLPPLICSASEHNTLKQLSHYAGGPAVMALADLLWETKLPDLAGDLNTFGGNGIGAMERTSSRMLEHIARYDELLKEYEGLKNHRAAPNTLKLKQAELARAFDQMNESLNRRGQQLLQKHAFPTRETLNQTGRVVRESIPLMDNLDVQKLAKLAKVGRIAGPGFIALDGYIRANEVYHMRKAGDPGWKRRAVVQSGAFAAGIGAGVVIAFAVSMTPFGLAVGLVLAGTAAVVADHTSQSILGMIYDWFQ
jgi:hypothetical protein